MTYHRASAIMIPLVLLGCDRGDRTNTSINTMSPFTVGQVWTYHTRPQEEASRIIVCRIESDPKLGQIVHVHVNGLRFRNSQAPGGYSDQIGHMPYSAVALRDSVVSLESSGAELPDFEEGYQQWRSAFDSGKGGVWTAPVSEAIAGMESAINQ